jgi:dipeptidyl aminopeptidase/acylaminoacyl peptidase
MKSILLICLLFTYFVVLHAQKPALSAKEYDTWKTLKNQSFSSDGNWLTYEIMPYRGDSKGFIMKSDSSFVKEFQRLTPTAFWSSEAYLLGLIKPEFDTVRKMELDKIKKEKLPKDSLFLYHLATDSVTKIANIIDYKYASKGHWIAYRNQEKAVSEKKEKESVQQKTKKKKWFNIFKKKTAAIQVDTPKIESDGKLLTLWNPKLNKVFTTENATSYEVSDSGKYVAIVFHEKKKKKDVYTLKINQFPDNKTIYESPSFTSIGKMTWNKSEQFFAFLASQDTNANNKHFSLYHLDLIGNASVVTLDSLKIGHPGNFIPSNFATIAYAEDGNRLFFGLAPKPKYDAKDTLTPAEKVKLDLWHWQDDKLQPKQLLSAKKDKNASFLSYFDWSKDQIYILENDTLKTRFNPKQSRVFLASNEEPYSIDQDHDYPWRRDEYLIIPEGENPLSKPFLLNKGSGFASTLAPNGQFAITYNEESNSFQLWNTLDKSNSCLSCQINIDWFEDLNGQIYKAQPDVKFAWLSDRESLWLITEHDVFQIQIGTLKTTRLTEQIGSELKQSFSVVNWDKDSLYINPNRSYLQGFSMSKKETNVYSIEQGKPKLLKNIYANIAAIQKVENADVIGYKISSVHIYPDLILDNLTFTNSKKITAVNPQQSEFNWANVELITWKTKKGVPLEGLLYTPENLDPKGSYPMIVYYYELNSENIHRHYTPRPTASVVYPTEYCSGGYVIFIPDIRYTPGYPAQSAYDCILSGTDFVLKKYSFIDSSRMGLQGQSWGGYQSAQLITMTTRYKAAMAGAPVSNMFSAYGGIRWSSGASRQFQYEHAQSRIGATIWERPDLYTLNSPLFGLPKVKTPLLIMHNDNDGAVPWYQGVELFMGLRRLKKPVWLLNYNGDEHNLMIEANRKDLSIRMRAFFDYYLNKGPMPIWMKDGIKAIDK